MRNREAISKPVLWAPFPCLGSGRREGRGAVVCAFAKDGPCDSSHLVGQCDNGDVAMASCRKASQPFAESGRLSLHLHHYGSSAVKHHASQILVAQLADAEQPCLAAGRVLSRNEPQPGCQVSSLSEADAVADGRNQCRRDDRSEPRNLHQALASIVLLGDAGKLGTGFFDLPFKLVPLMFQLTHHVQ